MSTNTIPKWQKPKNHKIIRSSISKQREGEEGYKYYTLPDSQQYWIIQHEVFNDQCADWHNVHYSDYFSDLAEAKKFLEKRLEELELDERYV